MEPLLNIDKTVASQGYLWSVARRFLAFFLVAAAVLGVIAVTHYYVSMRTDRIEHETSELLNVELGRTAIASALENVTSDLMFLAKHNELQGIFERDQFESYEQLATEFLVFMTEKQIYDQIRFLDETGKEIVRVNYNNGNPAIVGEDELQNKANRYYFGAVWTLGRDEVYISPLDLNIERGLIEQPPKPMIRFGTPVFDRTGYKTGIVLLNYFGEKLIREFRRAAANISNHVMLLNADGFWLSNPRRENEWGFMYNNDNTFEKAHPDAWQRIQAGESGQFHNDEGMFSFTTIYPRQHAAGNQWSIKQDGSRIIDRNYHWKIVSHLSPRLMSITPASFLHRHLLLYVGMAGLLAIASLSLARGSVRHKQTTTQLEFERRFREVLEGVDLLAVGLDIRGKIAFCNESLLKLLGRKSEDVIGKNWFNTFVPAAGREQSKVRFHNLVSEDAVPRRHQSEIQRRNGERRLISWNDTLLFDPQRRVIGLTCIGEDVTESRQNEEQLRKLSQAVEQSPSTVIITDTGGKIEYVNPQFTQLTGYTLDEVRGKNPRVLKSGETSSEEYKRLWETITSGGEWRGVFHNKKKNGELYWEATCISPIRNAEGAITHFLAVKEDITERKHLEERLRRVVESAPNGIVMVNQEGKMVLVNFQTEKLFGYKREELMEQPVEVLVPERFRGKHSEYRKNLFTEGRSRTMGAGRDLYGLRKDGSEFPVEIGLSPIETDEGKLILGAIVDITERKRLEKELEDTNREIARTQALAVVGRMAGMVAHDLRNPLSSVKMSLQMLSTQNGQDWAEAEHELKQIALEQVRYMEELMADLLTYSRPDALKPEWLNVDKLLDTAVILAQKHIDEHKVRVKTAYQSGLPTVHGDTDKLRRAFSNIIINAVQATDGIVGRRPQVNISARLELGSDRPRIRIEISDNGCGIEPGQEEAVFEPFFTTRAKGTGLGLPIVKRIVDQHGGSVRLRPAGTGGTCAAVVLPTGPVESTVKPVSTVEPAQKQPRQKPERGVVLSSKN